YPPSRWDGFVSAWGRPAARGWPWKAVGGSDKDSPGVRHTPRTRPSLRVSRENPILGGTARPRLIVLCCGLLDTTMPHSRISGSGARGWMVGVAVASRRRAQRGSCPYGHPPPFGGGAGRGIPRRQ